MRQILLATCHANTKVKPKVRKQRKRCIGIQVHRRDDRIDLLLEEPLQGVFVQGVCTRRFHTSNPLALEDRFDRVQKALILIGNDLVDSTINCFQLLCDGRSTGIRCLNLLSLLELQTPNSHHEKFIHVASSNRQEFESFNYRNLGILCLVEHPLIEF